MSVPPLRHDPSLTPAELEETSVHSVYEAIAPHFSQTRHKAWPLIARFLTSLPPHTIGLDSGAGNGKYLPDAEEEGKRWAVALDRSQGLLDIARYAGQTRKGKGREVDGDGRQEGGYECVRGDLAFEGWRQGVFDWTISVAAIHHLSTPARRLAAVQALLRPLALNREAPYSRFLIYVWAYEQGERSRRKMGTRAPEVVQSEESAGLGSAEGSQQTPSGSGNQGRKEQDVLVPWVLQGPPRSTPPTTYSSAITTPPSEPQVFERYYHLFVAGELRQLVESAAKEDDFTLLPAISMGTEAGDSYPVQGVSEGQKWLRIRGEGWEMDNWWIEGEVGMG